MLFSRFQKLLQSMRDKEFRESYVEAHINDGLAFQIRAMRKDRALSQKDFADALGTKQAAVSRLENPDYGHYNIETLKKVASIFDVGLMVRFVPFTELARKTCQMNNEDLSVPSFEDDVSRRPDKVETINKYESFDGADDLDSDEAFDVTIRSPSVDVYAQARL